MKIAAKLSVGIALSNRNRKFGILASKRLAPLFRQRFRQAKRGPYKHRAHECEHHPEDRARSESIQQHTADDGRERRRNAEDERDSATSNAVLQDRESDRE